MICPLISRCNEKVTLEKYIKVCSNVSEDAFLQCPAYQRLSKEEKTPAEWSRTLTIRPPSIRRIQRT